VPVDPVADPDLLHGDHRLGNVLQQQPDDAARVEGDGVDHLHGCVPEGHCSVGRDRRDLLARPRQAELIPDPDAARNRPPGGEHDRHSGRDHALDGLTDRRGDPLVDGPRPFDRSEERAVDVEGDQSRGEGHEVTGFNSSRPCM